MDENTTTDHEGELPADPDLGPAQANDDDDIVEKGKHATHDALDDIEEVLPQGAHDDAPNALP